MLAGRWVVLIALFIARFCLGFQFQSVGSVSPMLMGDLQLDHLSIGLLIGLFMLPGVVLAFPLTVLTASIGDRQVVLLGLTLTVIGGVFASISDSFAVLALGRLVSGAGAALLLVVLTKIMIDQFSNHDLFWGMSIFIIGWPVGIAAGQATQAALADLTNWRIVFVATSIACLLSFVATSNLYRGPRDPSSGAATITTGISGSELWLINIAGLIWMLLNGAYVTVLTFAPAYLVEQGISIVEAGAIVSGMSWVFILALPLGGYVTSRYLSPNVVILIGLGGATLIGLSVPFAGHPLLTFALFGMALSFATPVVATLPAEVLRSENRALGLGIYFTWFFAGVSVLPILGGALADHTGTTAASLLLGVMMLGLCVGLVGFFRWEARRLRATIAAA
ncbi:MAG: MFS transporter [Hyphomicrobiaceae bacterium]